jgi:uncharacterized HAD superfamily protein
MRIGLDFDDVVADSGIAIIAMHNAKHGTNFKKEDFANFFFEETWGVPREERNKEIDEFFATDQLTNIDPMAGSLKAIRDLRASGHELYIITGRPNRDIEQTELWIEHHFLDVFAGIHFASPSRTEEIQRKKSETCKALHIDIFIDDDAKNVLDCAAAGIKTFIFDQPWNRQGEFPANVERVYSWDEIAKKFSS